MTSDELMVRKKEVDEKLSSEGFSWKTPLTDPAYQKRLHELCKQNNFDWVVEDEAELEGDEEDEEGE